MYESLSDEFKGFFLLEFTKQLLIHSAKRDITRLQGIINTNERIQPALPVSFNSSVVEIIPKQIIPKQRQVRMNMQPAPRLFIPEPKLPSHLEYLKPVASQSIEIDLWKLNPLIKDGAVRTIEVNPDEQVVVSGNMGIKPTSIVLNKDDIDRVIERFSELAKIPTSEGVYRVVVGNLILSAILSEVVGSRFIIKKMAYQIPNSQLMNMGNPNRNNNQNLLR